MQGQNTEEYDQDKRVEPAEQMALRSEGVDGESLPVSTRRRFGAILFGVFYGGALLNGIEEGLEYVLKTEGYVLGQWPLVESVVKVASGALSGFFAAYCGRSLLCGVTASGLLAALFFAIAYWFGDGKPLWALQATSIGIFAAGAATAPLGVKLRVPAKDIASGWVFGVSWKHWLWLHIPWRLMIATAVSAAYPISLTMNNSPGWGRLGWEIIRAPLYVGMIAYGTLKALESLQVESPFTRTQAALRFLWWFLLFPVFVNLLRLVGL